MEQLNQKHTKSNNSAESLYEKGKDTLTEAYQNTKETTELYGEKIKNKVSDLYGEGKYQLKHLEESMEEYSDELIQKVQERPLTSLLIAGGIGYILAKVMHK